MNSDSFVKKISVIGLGKLGLPLAAAIASSGWPVIGYDKDARKIDGIEAGRLPYEPSLEDHIKKGSRNLLLTSEASDLMDSNLTFIVVPTPSQKNGNFSLSFLISVLQDFGKVLKEKRGFHIVSIVSTVLPGSMQKLEKILEKASAKKCGHDFGLCYNPAFIALGNVIENFKNPDFVLIGESDKKSGQGLEAFYKNFCSNEPEIHRMNYVNAEISKISVNTFITMKISFGNMIARLAERLPGAHSGVITDAIGADKRIGKRYLKGALGYGGPCFPRDNRAFSFLAKQVGLRAYAAEATDKINQYQTSWLAEFVLSRASKKDTVAILGLSYKPDTDVIEESQGILLARELLKMKRKLVLYDPLSVAHARTILGDRVLYAKNLTEACKLSKVLVLTTPWKEFRQLISEWPMNGSASVRKLIIDPWRILEWEKTSGFDYIPLGVAHPLTTKK